MNKSIPMTFYSVLRLLYFLFYGILFGIAALSLGVHALFTIYESTDLKAFSAVWLFAYFLFFLLLLFLSLINLKKSIYGNQDTEQIEIIKRTKEIDELLEREREALQRDSAARNAVMRNWITPFYLWGAFCRYMSVFVFLWIISKWLPLDNIADKPILEISLREIASIIVLITVVRVAFYWLGLIDTKILEERNEIYSGWGLAGLAAIALVLLLLYS